MTISQISKLGDVESDGKSSWGALITYNTPEEKEEILKQLEHYLIGIKRINLEDLSRVNPSIGIINCIDISNQRELMLGGIDAGQRVMGWIKSYKVVLLCKEWEWELLKSRDGRWTSHLVLKPTDELGTIRQAAEELAESIKINTQNNRLVLYEYLNNRSLFNEFLNTNGIDSSIIQSIIDKKGLWDLDEQEYELLLRSNEEILRYIAAQELNSRRGTRFNRQEFTDLFGEIPIRMGLQANPKIFDDLLDGIHEKQFNSSKEFADIECLVGLLTLDGFENNLHNGLCDFLDSEKQKVYTIIHECEQREHLEQRIEYLGQFIDSPEIESLVSAFASVHCLVQMEQETTPTRLLEHYDDQLEFEDKARVSRLLLYQLEIGAFASRSNHQLIADFLREEGPKLVLLLDGLSLTDSSTRDFYSDKESDAEWETNYGVAPAPTVTKKFLPMLTEEYSFNQLGGFYDDSENLSILDLDAFLGEEKEEELLNLLNRGESVIIYDPNIDQGGHFPTDVHIKVRDYLKQKIPEFVEKYGEYTDVLITSDHGMVETFKPQKMSKPDSTGQRGLLHCRSTFTDSIDSVEAELADDNVSYIHVELPNSNEDCLMINPDNPHSKFGDQTGNLWIHGGISIEESVVPAVIRRR